MAIYLDQLRSTLNDVQSKHISNLLKKQKDSGEIKNLEDFRARLSELTAQILSDRVEPSLQVFFAQLNEVIDSDTYNFMLDRIRDDLEAIFSELNTLDEIVDAHTNLINNIVLKAIKLGINELENKITFYEFMASNPHGFTQSLFNTFSGASNNRTYRTDPDVGIFFEDPRSGDEISSDVTVDTVGERILLGSNILKHIPIKQITQLFDEEAVQSEEAVAFSSEKISNVIDGTRGTYWTYSNLQNNIDPNGIKAKFELDLGVDSEINFIEIESAAIFPMNIVQIEYLDPNNDFHEINLHQPLLNRTNRIDFAKITASKINIVVEQLNALEVQYENKAISDNYDSVISKSNPLFSTNSIAKEIRQTVMSSKLLENAFMITQSAKPGAAVKYFDYTVGFDNIRVGNSEYVDTSIYVSSPITIDNLTQIGLKSKELRPIYTGGITTFTADTYPVSDAGGYFLSSIEYYAVLQNYNINDRLIDINKIPILPTGISYVSHEALTLAYKVGVSLVPNTGVLRFYTAHFTDDQIEDIKVYRNGTLLTYLTDWIFEEFPYTNDFVPPNGQRNSVGIRILDPTNTDFYTVSYTPMVSNTRVDGSLLSDLDIEFDTDGIIVVDLVGDGSATLSSDSTTHIISKKHSGQDVAYTKVNLVIVLRKNSTDNHISAGVDEFTLLLHNKT